MGFFSFVRAIITTTGNHHLLFLLNGYLATSCGKLALELRWIFQIAKEFVGIREQKLGTQRFFVALFRLNLAVFVGRLTRFVSPTVATTTILSNLDARKGIIIWARLIWAPALLSRSDLYIDAQQYISALKANPFPNS